MPRRKRKQKPKTRQTIDTTNEEKPTATSKTIASKSSFSSSTFSSVTITGSSLSLSPSSSPSPSKKQLQTDAKETITNKTANSTKSVIFQISPTSGASCMSVVSQTTKDKGVQTIRVSMESQISDNELSSDANEQFRTRTVYRRKNTDPTYEKGPKRIKFAPTVIDTQSKLNADYPKSYIMDYNEMNRKFSNRTLAEIYDDEFFNFSDKYGHQLSIGGLKEGIFSCLVTGLAVACLVLGSYFVILLVDPIVDAIDAVFESFSNITKYIVGKQTRRHRDHH